MKRLIYIFKIILALLFIIAVSIAGFIRWLAWYIIPVLIAVGLYFWVFK